MQIMTVIEVGVTATPNENDKANSHALQQGERRDERLEFHCSVQDHHLRVYILYIIHAALTKRSKTMKRRSDSAAAPASKLMRMTRMKRVLEEMTDTGPHKRIRSTGSEKDEVQRTLGFRQDELDELKKRALGQAERLLYQDRRIKELNASLLEGKHVVDRLVTRIQVLESEAVYEQSYSSEFMQRPFYVS